ncbi:HNH endonuclease signature motif containing protein [Nocardioides sp. ChNu-99]|uniref:HNH endonuclease signature motif containing protein n=1 Tax=Nocardioides sp. ChNu-99 TaxID=2839897 RepID=UPI002404C0E3|nr:HNH endonuclease signature motif containing protein [Nocardioides sp. ChNu-99]MDF9716580.1 HNH endonuclease [Nocardioides sp. ChNu-99]
MNHPSTAVVEAPAAPDATALLASARAAASAQMAAEVATFVAVADWADAHTDGTVGDPIGPLGLWTEDPTAVPGGDRFLELGGPGAPLVSEFCLYEISAALGRSVTSGRPLVGDAIELRHRLPRLYARVAAGADPATQKRALPVWRARKIAALTRTLTAGAADFVDRNLAPVAHRATMPTVERLVAEAIARFDPENADLDRADADAGRYFTIETTPIDTASPWTGVVPVHGTLDIADALDLNNAVQRVAADLAAAGCDADLDVRRSMALGELARRQTTLDLYGATAVDGGEAPIGSTRTSARQVVLYVHLSDAALASHRSDDGPGIDPATGHTGIDLARLENTRTLITADQVRDWCRTPGTKITVKPVIDLSEHVAVDAYEIPDRIAERVRLDRPTCAFPYCGRPARGLDLDHTHPYRSNAAPGAGQTSTANLAPLCRGEHRAKTHPSLSGASPPDSSPTSADPPDRRWRYHRDPHGTYLWTSPHGLRYAVDPTGTTPLD